MIRPLARYRSKTDPFIRKETTDLGMISKRAVGHSCDWTDLQIDVEICGRVPAQFDHALKIRLQRYEIAF